MRFDRVGRILQRFAADEAVRLLKSSGSMHIPSIGTMTYDAEKHSISFTPSEELLERLEGKKQ